jgi:hypothetical protein
VSYAANALILVAVALKIFRELSPALAAFGTVALLIAYYKRS